MTTLCGCGCGEPAGVYAASNPAAGIVKGQPKRFIHGHHGRVQDYPGAAANRLPEQYDVNPATGCWEWRVIHNGSDGYGVIWVKGRKTKAHRYVYEQVEGPIPPGVHLDHICRNRACVNPEHLRPLPHAENCRIGARAKLTQADADEIRRRLAAGAMGITLAAEYGVSPATISGIRCGHSWA